MLELAEALLVAAISRRESRGAHYRIDFPTSHESYKARSIIWKKDGVICGDFIKVGDEVITNGLDGIFFTGLKVGKVVKILNNNQNYKEAIVSPYAKQNIQQYYYVY